MSEAPVMDRHERYVKTMTIRRVGRIIAYLCLAVAGALATFGPPTLIENQVSNWVAPTWGFCMLISALLALYGAVTDRWIGEFSGLPLLFTVLGFFSIALFKSAWDENTFPVYAYALTILALASKLVARWQDIRDIKVEAESLGSMAKEA